MLLHASFTRMRAAGLGASGGQGARSHALVGCGWEVGACPLPPPGFSQLCWSHLGSARSGSAHRSVRRHTAPLGAVSHPVLEDLP